MASAGRPAHALADATSFFNGRRLTMARQLAGLRKARLAELIGMSPASVTGWESGAKQPNRVTVAKLALALRVEPQFFAGGVPPRVEKPHFRSLRSTPQIAQDEAEAYGQFVTEIANLLEKVVELPDTLLPDLPVAPDGADVSPEEAAREARDFFGITPGPLQHVVRLAERAGVVVVFSEPGIAAIDAYSLHTGMRPIIVLNPVKDDYYRQRFDVAHEIGHLIMHHDAEPGGKVAEEQANRFAAEFLMPAEEIGPYLPTTTAGRGWVKLAELKEHWGVSLAALLYRARTLGVMGDVTYRNAMIRMSQKGWRRAEPGRISSLEAPSMLARAREALNEAGIEDEQLLFGGGLPLRLFEMVISRTPVFKEA
ncbi:ImmA/IrrE family metallo-endopeptidase [Rathayibacter toxicus]|nr:Xre family DNA binding protein [Rathayibacter toxicus]QOD11549.1 XRE family transcriptional regulator [Rathayibacter toxicus]QWL29272.1 ImmA/IrrE family metallo-endopeptidase [Rathayibacter toxicus]